jgi:hypothetical protein
MFWIFGLPSRVVIHDFYSYKMPLLFSTHNSSPYNSDVHFEWNFTFSWPASYTFCDSQLFFVYNKILLTNMQGNAKSLLKSDIIIYIIKFWVNSNDRYYK